jgi:hypothetical protein
MLNSNATTVWEVWFESDSTYSHNHAMMTSVTEWALKHVVGLQLAAEAWQQCVASRLFAVCV